MRNVLLVVDGARQGEAAARKVVALGRRNEVGAIHLLNVQPRFNGHIARFLDRATMRDYQRDEGCKALSATRAILDEAGLAYTAHVHAGPVAETIAETADELGVHEIIMAADGLGMLDRVMLRFLVARVLNLTDVPVLLVKSGKGRAAGRLRPAFSR